MDQAVSYYGHGQSQNGQVVETRLPMALGDLSRLMLTSCIV